MDQEVVKFFFFRISYNVAKERTEKKHHDMSQHDKPYYIRSYAVLNKVNMMT